VKKPIARASPAQRQLSVASTMGAETRGKRSSSATTESATRWRPRRCRALGQKPFAAYHGGSGPGSKRAVWRRRKTGSGAKP